MEGNWAGNSKEPASRDYVMCEDLSGKCKQLSKRTLKGKAIGT
jgi:hypothetical protein